MNNVKTPAKKAKVTKIEVANTLLGPIAIPGHPTSKKVVKVKNAVKPILTSRTKICKLMKANGGKFGSVTFIDQKDQPRTINFIHVKNQIPSELGYILVHSVQDKGFRNVNSQTILGAKIGGISYKARK